MKMIHYFSDKAKLKYIKANTILQNRNVKQYKMTFVRKCSNQYFVSFITGQTKQEHETEKHLSWLLFLLAGNLGFPLHHWEEEE